MSSSALERRLAFLVGPLVLAAAVGAALAIRHFQPVEIFGAVVGGLIVVVLGWTLVSTLWPPRADRTCPACGSNGLERLDPRTTMGIRCRECGFRDPDRSSWLLAEEEGPLEGLIADEPPPRRRPVDTGGGAD